MDAEALIREYSDPLWLHQHEMWEYLQTEETDQDEYPTSAEDERLLFGEDKLLGGNKIEKF